jgi:hypothetical protein
MNAMLQPLTRLGARMHPRILYLLCVVVSQFFCTDPLKVGQKFYF